MSRRSPEQPRDSGGEGESSRQPGPEAVEERPEPLFPLRQTVVTPGTLAALAADEQDPGELLARQVAGDWGDLEEEDQQENEFSVKRGFRILLAYKLPL